MAIFVKPLSCSEFEKPLKQHLGEIFVISLFGILTGLSFCEICLSSPKIFFYMYIYSGSIWISQWKGHSFISDYIDRKVQWFTHPYTRTMFTIIQLLVYTPISLFVINYLSEEYLNISTGFFTTEGFWLVTGISIGIGTFITLLSLSSQFLGQWRQSEINAEKLKAENIASQFETLKNQVNPHFLFNSLNVLTNLVYHDQDKAAEFIKKLSDVYRYVLEMKGKDLVDLSDELNFVQSYLFLQQIRFGNNLKVKIDDFSTDYKVAPMSIQMLLENAIKHNVVSKEDPLTISISMNGNEQLLVTNNLQKKNVMEGESQGIGLDNIKQRYTYLADEPIVVDKSNGKFTVKIPLLKS